MAEDNPDGRQAGGLNPQALPLTDLAKILSSLGPKSVTVEMLQADIDDGAPANRDGTVNLIHYASWLAREVIHGGD